jgi:hypothetical protein
MLVVLVRRLLEAFGLGERSVLPELATAIVVIDRENLSASSLSLRDEQEIVSRLSERLEGVCDFDGVDWSIDRIRWFFFGRDVDQLESALLDQLRAEPRCKGGLLRVTAGGIGGPWRETRI